MTIMLVVMSSKEIMHWVMVMMIVTWRCKMRFKTMIVCQMDVWLVQWHPLWIKVVWCQVWWNVTWVYWSLQLVVLVCVFKPINYLVQLINLVFNEFLLAPLLESVFDDYANRTTFLLLNLYSKKSAYLQYLVSTQIQNSNHSNQSILQFGILWLVQFVGNQWQYPCQSRYYVKHALYQIRNLRHICKKR